MTKDIGFLRTFEELLTNRIIELGTDLELIANRVAIESRKLADNVAVYHKSKMANDLTKVVLSNTTLCDVQAKKKFVKSTLDWNQYLLDWVEEQIYCSKIEDPTKLRVNFDREVNMTGQF